MPAASRRLFLVLFHRLPGLEFGSRATSITRTTTEPTLNKVRTNTGRRVHWCQRTQFRFFAQPSKDQHVYAQSALPCPGGTH